MLTMRRIQRVVIATALAVSTSAAVSGHGAPAADSLAQRIDEFLGDSSLASSFIGIKIVSLPDGAMLYSRNADKLFHPASNLKLFTTAAALNLLDSSFRLRTEFYGKFSGHTLSGITVRGFGDPLLSTDDLDLVARQLKARGVRGVNGDLRADVSYFDDVPWGHGWMWDDEPDADEAFISPLTVNGNAVRVTVRPGRARSIHAEMEPPNTYMRLANAGFQSGDTSLPPLEIKRKSGERIFHITGRMPPGSAPREFSLSVVQPEFYLLHLLRERLEARGIHVKGRMVRAKAAKGEKKIAEITRPLDSVIVQINKKSDNVAAENIVKILGASPKPPGTWERGLSALRDFACGAGIDTAGLRLSDGSGVSMYNLATPESFIRLLKFEYASRKTYSRFYASLPIAGVDGTLHNRMHGTPGEGNVRAKTGSLTGVSSLSGYVTTGEGKLVAFSILIDHFPGEVGRLRAVQDSIMSLLALYRGGAR